MTKNKQKEAGVGPFKKICGVASLQCYFFISQVAKSCTCQATPKDFLANHILCK